MFIVNNPRIVVSLASYEDVLSANFEIIKMLMLNDDKKSLTNLTKNQILKTLSV
ncbi:MAG: phage tail domain-containing protein [Psychrobacter sp.]